MNKQALSLAVFIAGAYPAASQALGLGDIESSSHLNQPLRAKIELLAAAPADASQIQVRLAPPDVFNRVGVARPDFLSNLSFTPSVQGGKPVILVTSDAPIQEPFVNFLLEVSWPQGQLLKEYTVMLDPPVMLQPGNTVAGGEAAVRAEPKAAGNVRRQQQGQQQQQANAADGQEQAQQAAAPSAGSRTYRVKPGDTLFKVASRLQQSGVSNEQMMVALFRANPGAFINKNLNNLRSGVTLKAPNAGDVGKVSRAEARRQIRQQNAEWREFRQSLAKNTVPQKMAAAPAPSAEKPDNTAKPANSAQQTPVAAEKDAKARLEVLGGKDGKADAKNASAAGANEKLADLEKQLLLARESLTARQKENDELKSRVGDLESMLAKKNRLIDLRNEQLATLQKQLSDSGVKTTPLSDNPEAGNNTGAATPATPSDPGKDLQAHLANVEGKGDNTVLRGEQPPTANANTPAKPEQPAPATPVAPPAAVSQPATPVTPSAPPAAVAPISPPASPSLTPPPLTPPAPVAVVPVKPVPAATPPAPAKAPPVFADEQDDGDLLGLLTSPLALQIGAGSLALLLLLWLLGRRRKSGDDDKGKKRGKVVMDPPVDHALDEFAAIDGRDGGRHSGGRFAAALDDADGFSADDASPWGSPAAQGDMAAAQGLAMGEASYASQTEEDDLLTEANVYIAYGLYQQAESELKKGIERDPEKLEYRHKLLECYFVSNNREAFDRQAEQFAAMQGRNKDALWKGVVDWGQKISPDNALYHAGGAARADSGTVAAVGAAAAAAVASAAFAAHDEDGLFMQGLDVEADFSETKPAQPPLPTPSAPEAVVPETPSAMEDLGDLDLGDLDFDDLDLDKLLQGDERPAPQPASSPTAVEVAVTPAVPAPHDDFALPDLDLDFDPAFDLDMGLGDKGDKPVAAAPAMEQDNLLDFITEGAGEVAPVPSVAAATAATNLNLHLDNKNLNRILPKDTFYAPATGDGANQDQDWLGDIDDALSFLDFPDDEIDLHEAHISTKLDLARAYLDMGDIEGARSTLEEVMVEGNDDQRREAEVLLHQTG